MDNRNNFQGKELKKLTINNFDIKILIIQKKIKIMGYKVPNSKKERKIYKREIILKILCKHHNFNKNAK